MCLDATRIPMAVWAGPDLTLIYNQNYAAMLGPCRHPRALARPAREVCPELCERLGRQLRRLTEHGEGTHYQGAPLGLDRGSGDDDTLVMYSLTPVRGGGEVVAALNVIHGTTRRARLTAGHQARSTASQMIGEAWRPREIGAAQGCAGPGARCKRGPLEFCAVAAEDITEPTRAAQVIGADEERFRTLADNIAQLAWTADKAGSIVWYNQRWYDYTGTTFDEVQGWRWQNVVHPDHAEQVVAKIRRCFETGERWEDTFPLRGHTGEYRWFLSRAFPIRDEAGRVVLWFGTNTDITEQRATEEALREADRHKTEFLGWLSHELRNPLGIIRTSLALIERADLDSEPGRRALSVIDRQAAQMGRLLDDLLDITRISKGKVLLRRKTVTLNEIVRATAEDYRQVFRLEGISFDVRLTRERLHAYVDGARIEQIVGNVLQNATKFTPRGGRVALSLRAGRNDEGIIEVRDDGAGISSGLIARIFDPLVQDNRTVRRSRGGLGLGLPLVKGLVELHGGTVSASSEGPGRGAVFTIRLPLRRRRSRP
jgi:PAS domain S-box-containing protein